MDTNVKGKIIQKLSDIMGVENPNSVLQMRSWLFENGFDYSS